MSPGRKNKYRFLKTGAVITAVFFALAAVSFFFFLNPPPSGRTTQDIAKSGVLRVLTTPPSDLRGLQRGITPIDLELAMLSAFADELGVTMQIVYVEKFDELGEALSAGRGDLAADNLTVTPEREKNFLFSEPIASADTVVVARRDVAQLAPGARIVAMAGTVHEGMLKKFPADRTSVAHEQPEELIAMVASGVYDAVVTDDNFLRAYLRYRDDVHAVAVLGKSDRIAWALGKRSAELKQRLDDFIARRGKVFSEDASTADLDGIRDRRMLRVLTRDNPVNYYTEGGEFFGFEYEMAKRFADEQKLQLVMVTPPDHSQLIPYLQAGRGDLIAASMTVTPQRQDARDVVFSTPYVEVREVLVQRRGSPPLRRASDLARRTVTVRSDSSYAETLRTLIAGGVDVKLDYVKPEVESVEILGRVASGEADLTLIDNLIGRNAYCNGISGIDFSIVMSGNKRYAWMVRASNPQLLAAVNAFLEKDVNGKEFKLSYDRYFMDSSVGAAATLEDSSGADSISPFDPLVRRVAESYFFDWRLLAAQVCQESRFDPKAVAPDGGAGLMQLMPETIREMRCRDPFDPEQNLNAGAGYLAKQRDRLGREVKTMDRIYFALAAYNAGYGHLADARRLAIEIGKDPNVWFDNVEEAMKLLSRKAYYSRTRYGYCRSDIVIRYVRQIRDRFETYRANFTQ